MINLLQPLPQRAKNPMSSKSPPTVVTPLPRQWCVQVVRAALMEDIGMGDVSARVAKEDHRLWVSLLAKSGGVLAGMDLLRLAFELEEAAPQWAHALADGAEFEPGQVVCRFSAMGAAALRAERTALNFLGHLSGVATLTRAYVNALPPGVSVAATRKTTPGLRVAEKYAVAVGGGLTHRLRLDDMVLLKENHLRAAGGIGPAVKRARQGLSHHLKVQVEVTTLAEIREALVAGVDMLLLDNFTPEALNDALALVNGQKTVEISGGVRLSNLAQFARPGVDIISVGELTGAAPRSDFSLLFDG